MSDPLPAAAARPGPALLTAAAVVVLGTAVVDVHRLPLLLIPLSFLLAAYATGLLLELPQGRASDGERPAMTSLAVRLGLGIAGLAVTLVISALLLQCFTIAIAVVAALAVSGSALLMRSARHLRPRTPSEWLPSVAGGGAFGLLWLLAWLWGTIPPIFYDELAYHLVIPQQALATGKDPALPWVYFSFMPHASDLLLAWGMVFSGEIGARAAHVALWMAATLAAWGLAEGVAGPAAAAWAGAPLAGAIASSATFWYLGTLTFAETALTGAVLTAASLLVLPSEKPRPWFSLGLLLGLAAAVKLSGLAWALAGLAAARVAGWSGREVSRAGLVALACVSPWWVRAWLHTGNPVYPFGYGLFGGRYWSPESQARLHADLPPGAEDMTWQNLLRLPLDLVQHPERFGSASDAGLLALPAMGLLLLLPVLCRLMPSSPRRRRLADAAALFTLLTGAAWVLTSTTTRFFAPAWLLGLATLAGLALRLERWGRAATTVVLLLFGLSGAAGFIVQHDQVFGSFAVAVGREAPETYLARRLDHYDAARFARDRLPPGAQVLFIGEARPYYFGRAALAPYPFQDHPLAQWLRESSSSEDLARRVGAEGYSHVILNAREYARLRAQYGMLAFHGAEAPLLDRRLKEFPRALETLFAGNGVYIFAVPASPGT